MFLDEKHVILYHVKCWKNKCFSRVTHYFFVLIRVQFVFLGWKNVSRKKTKSIDNWDFFVKINISREKYICLQHKNKMNGGT
jgi:hypothetical protein